MTLIDRPVDELRVDLEALVFGKLIGATRVASQRGEHHGQNMARTARTRPEHGHNTWPEQYAHATRTPPDGQHMASTWPEHGQNVPRFGQQMARTWPARMVNKGTGCGEKGHLGLGESSMAKRASGLRS